MKFVKSVKFQYISDIHLESCKSFPKLQVKSDNLILAGDIGNPFQNNYKDFLSYCSSNYEKIFLITGNHEYWNSRNIYEVDEHIFKITSSFENIHFMKNKVISFKDIFIVGCTLWSQIGTNSIKGDESHIRVDTKFLNKLHKQDVNWLQITIDSLIPYNKKILVITHHLPSFKLLDKKYKNNKCQDRFYSHLDHLIQYPIDTWICGHTHCTMEKTINNVNFKVNSLGYIDNINDKIKTLEIQ